MSEYGERCEHKSWVDLCEKCEIDRLRAENEKLRAAIEIAIRQHEDGNKGLAHRTLCEAVYGEQA